MIIKNEIRIIIRIIKKRNTYYNTYFILLVLVYGTPPGFIP